MNLSNDVKIFGGIILATIVLIVGAIFFFGKDVSTTTSPQLTKVSMSTLVKSNSWAVGPQKAKVTLVEFGDFECPYCKQSEPGLSEARIKYKDNVLFVFRHFPLVQVHQFAMAASLAAEAAGTQGKFWEMHDKLYDNQPTINSVTGQVGDSFSKDKIFGYAKDLGLDMDKFTKDYDSDATRQHVLDDMADGNKVQVSGTPTFYVNGVLTDFGRPPTFSDLQSKFDPLLK